MPRRLPSEVLYEILHHSDISLLITLKRVCRCLRNMVSNELRISLKVYLRQFSHNPSQLLDAMRRCGAVISGSGALGWIDREAQWKANDLDIYCPYDTFPNFVSALLRSEGGVLYKHSIFRPSDTDQAYSFDAGISQRVIIIGPKCKFDILRSPTVSALHPIPFFHSTVVMNFVGAQSLSVAYPKLTLNRRGIIHSRVTGERDIDCIAKYIGRGYEFRNEFKLWNYPLACTPFLGMCPAAPRIFGDRGCMTTVFGDEEGIDVLKWNTRWVFGGDACGGLCTKRTTFGALEYMPL